MKKHSLAFETAVILLVSLVGGAVLLSAMAEEAAAPGQQGWVAPARAAKKRNPIESTQSSIAAGKTVYEKECLACHGTTGKGDGPQAKDLERPAGDLTNAKLWDQTDGALFWKVTRGNKPMPTYEQLLTEEQRWHVINYVRTLAPKKP